MRLAADATRPCGVRSTAAHLGGRHFTAAYVSPCGRAQATAHEILAHHPSALAVTYPDLREFCFGDLETRPEAELLDRYHPDSMFAEVLDGTFAGIPGGELGRDFLARVRSAFTRIESKPWHGSRSRREPRAAGEAVPDMPGASPTPAQVSLTAPGARRDQEQRVGPAGAPPPASSAEPAAAVAPRGEPQLTGYIDSIYPV